MSLSQAVTKVVDEVVQTYISRIAEQYNLDRNELVSLWSKNTDIKYSKPSTSSSGNSQLFNLKKAELIELCKAKGIKHTGTVPVLIARLSGGEEEQTSVCKKSVAKKQVVTSAPVIKKLVAKIPTVPIRRNQFGNFEHAETSFIFNSKTQKVIGKQNDDGTIEELTPEDINICNKYKFTYELPENLDKKTNLEDVQVEELEEEEEEDEEEEDEEEYEEYEEEEEEEEEYEEY